MLVCQHTHKQKLKVHEVDWLFIFCALWIRLYGKQGTITILYGLMKNVCIMVVTEYHVLRLSALWISLNTGPNTVSSFALWLRVGNNSKIHLQHTCTDE